jgi:MtN3 and saliva related transmembrane protein
MNGIIAASAIILDSSYQIPQLIKVVKTKQVDDLSIHSLLMVIISNVMWIIHGYIIMDMTVIVSNVLNIAITFPLLYLHRTHKRK